jgi:hypothetical protein
MATSQQLQERCEQLVATSHRIELQAFDFSEIPNFTEPQRQIVRYFRDVEGLVPVYAATLQRGPGGRNRLITEFLAKWTEEELVHSQLLNLLLGEDVKVSDPLPLSAGDRIAELLCKCSRRITRALLGLHMSWGMVNEELTQIGYRLLPELVDDRLFRRVCTRIRQDEARHSQFYGLMAQQILAESWLGRVLTRALLRFAWKPVGRSRGFKSREEFAVLAHHLQSAPGSAELLARADARVAALPGLHGLRVLQNGIESAVN